MIVPNPAASEQPGGEHSVTIAAGTYLAFDVADGQLEPGAAALIPEQHPAVYRLNTASGPLLMGATVTPAAQLRVWATMTTVWQSVTDVELWLTASERQSHQLVAAIEAGRAVTR